MAVSESRQRAYEKQKLKRKTVTLQLSLEQYAQIKERAEALRVSVHGLIISELF